MLPTKIIKKMKFMSFKNKPFEIDAEGVFLTVYSDSGCRWSECLQW